LLRGLAVRKDNDSDGKRLRRDESPCQSVLRKGTQWLFVRFESSGLPTTQELSPNIMLWTGATIPARFGLSYQVRDL
jgi:hypothetical protein